MESLQNVTLTLLLNNSQFLIFSSCMKILGIKPASEDSVILREKIYLIVFHNLIMYYYDSKIHAAQELDSCTYLRSSKISAIRKLSKDQSSSKLFCKGVPVKSKRLAEVYNRNSLINLQLVFFNRCPSSTTIYFHKTLWKW